MKAVYDKLLLLIALLVLAGSAVYFLFIAKGDSAVQRGDELLTRTPQNSPYQVVEVPQFERKEVPWPAPEPQDAEGNWLFDVFTPPRIYWDPVAQKLVSEPWQPPEQAPPFGLELIAIDQELFRIQLEAYFAASSGKPEEAQILFYNTESEEPFRGTVGTVFEDAEIRIDHFETKREFNPDGSVTTVGLAKVTDMRSGEQLELTASRRLYLPGKFTITLATTEPLPEQTFVWKAVGDKHEVDGNSFVLDAFDLEAKTVTVTKTSPKLPEPETETLNITRSESSAPAVGPVLPAGETPPVPGVQTGFEDLFR